MIKKIFIFLSIFVVSFIYGEEVVVDNRKIGLVLSGGGAKGFAHIGVLKVLDEEKVPVDYIVGTSMGSIIGAFYAMGYTGKEIEEIVLNKEWINYFNDSILREEELIENKIDRDKYMFSFSMKDWKVQLPKGVVKGQRIDSILSELYLDTKDIKDFSKLPIPFACVATDVETGKEVILDKGYLSDAIRASMSLPSILEPVELDDKLLIDGGVVNNFPATVAIDMGANYLIGVDIGAKLKKKDEINSFIDILNQTSSYKKAEANNDAREKTDLLFLPNMNDYELLSFDKAKQIIGEGERVAREQLDKIKKLKNEEEFNKIKLKKISRADKFLVDELVLEGNNNFDIETIKKIINVNLPIEFSREELTEIMEKIYSMRLVSKVDYKILGTKLILKVEDIDNKEIKFGLNYNDFSKGEFFLKVISKNVGESGNKVSGELLLGKDEVLKLEKSNYIGEHNRFGYSISAEYSNIEDFSIFLESQKLLEYNVELLNVNFMVGNFLSNSQMLGVGIKKEYSLVESNTQINQETIDFVGMGDLNKYKEDYNLIYLKYIYDTLDNKYFPKNGSFLNLDIQHSNKKIGDLHFTKYSMECNKPSKLSDKFLINTGMNFEYISGEDVALYYVPRLGGFYNRENSIPFWGLSTSSQITDRIFSVFEEVFYNSKLLGEIVLRYNVAFLNPNEANSDKIINGVGIGLVRKTPLGPIQLILSTSDKEDLISYINIGYNF